MTFVQIGEFNWLSGRQKGSFFVKIFKILPLRIRKENEAETWHTCKGHYSRIRTLVAMVTYSFHRLIIEKWNLEISTVSLEMIEFYFYRNVY